MYTVFRNSWMLEISSQAKYVVVTASARRLMYPSWVSGGTGRAGRVSRRNCRSYNGSEAIMAAAFLLGV